MALTKHFKKILKNSTFSIVSDPSYPYCMVEYHTGFGDTRKCETYYVLKSVLLPLLEQTKSVKTLLSVAKDNRLLGSDDTRLTVTPPTTTTDTKSAIAKGESVGVVDSVGVTPLASVLSEQTNSNPSDIVVCGSGVNPPPVAVSSYPAASDTPYKNMQSQRLGAAL